MKKIICGSSEIFKDVPGFAPGDMDYIILGSNDLVYEHERPREGVCLFIWGKDKNKVREYLLLYPDYLIAMSLLTKGFVDYFELTHKEIDRIIERHLGIYMGSIYRYVVPLFEHIRRQRNWDFPNDVVKKAYKLYKKYKVKVV